MCAPGRARSKLQLFTCVAFVLMSFAGCKPRDDTLPQDVTNALSRAFTRGDAAACAALYTDDAVIMSNAQTARGHDEIVKFFKDQVVRDILFATDSDVSVVRGDLAVDQGTYRVRDTQRGVDVEAGQYLNAWRRVDQHWRVFRSMYTITEGPRAGVSVTSEDDHP